MSTKSTAIILASLLVFTVCGKDKNSSGKTTGEIKTKSGIEMILIPAGDYMMGGDRPGETPAHRVFLSAFYIDKYEVTQEMYTKLDLSDPSHFEGQKKPVEQITWMNAAIYCNERSIEEGLEPCYEETTWECNYNASGYRLPTEAEWEYAARAGSTGKYFFGDPKNMRNYAVYNRNNSGGTENVGTKKPNNWGIYDMYGNVAEWCNDFYSASYYASSPESDPRGPVRENERVLRGGSWKDSEAVIYSGARSFDAPYNDACSQKDTTGFRCVRRADR